MTPGKLEILQGEWALVDGWHRYIGGVGMVGLVE